MRHRERYGHAAGAPDASRYDDVREAGRDEKGDARFVEVAGLAGKLRRDPARRLREVVMREHAVSGDDGEAVGSDASFYAAVAMLEARRHGDPLRQQGTRKNMVDLCDFVTSSLARSRLRSGATRDRPALAPRTARG
jgi:hypothetical protein